MPTPLYNKYNFCLTFESLYTLISYWVFLFICFCLVYECYRGNGYLDLDEIEYERWELDEYLDYLNYFHYVLLKMKIISIFIFLYFDPVLHYLHVALWAWSLYSNYFGIGYVIAILLYHGLMPILYLIIVIILLSLLYDDKFRKNKKVIFIKLILNIIVNVFALIVFDIAIYDVLLVIMYSNLLGVKCFYHIILIVIIYLFFLCICFFIHLVYCVCLFACTVIKP